MIIKRGIGAKSGIKPLDKILEIDATDVTGLSLYEVAELLRGPQGSDVLLKITDRKKDIIVNAGGDNISPTRIEAKIDIEPEIAQSMLYGDYKNYLVAVIVPDKDFALNWAKENGKDQKLESIVKDDDFNKLMKDKN